jgi:hypothetical protein
MSQSKSTGKNPMDLISAHPCPPYKSPFEIVESLTKSRCCKKLQKNDRKNPKKMLDKPGVM